jgi:hypothetical protein
MSGDLIVCGWHLPDYSHWLSLLADLKKLGHEHKFNLVPKPAGGWEKATLMKARVGSPELAYVAAAVRSTEYVRRRCSARSDHRIASG